MSPNQFLGKNFLYEVAMVILNQIFHYTHSITPKHVMSLQGPSQHHRAWAIQLLQRNLTVVANCWQHCAGFDWTEI